MFRAPFNCCRPCHKANVALLTQFTRKTRLDWNELNRRKKKRDSSGIFFLQFFILGDIIIKEGTIGTKMYFIQEGVVDIVMANGEVSLSFSFRFVFSDIFNPHFEFSNIFARNEMMKMDREDLLKKKLFIGRYIIVRWFLFWWNMFINKC